jgi:hypothetical protein
MKYKDRKRRFYIDWDLVNEYAGIDIHHLIYNP